jgi:hypothetical protein
MCRTAFKKFLLDNEIVVVVGSAAAGEIKDITF